MSTKTDEIIEQLKNLTLLETVELVHEMEEIFQVSASPSMIGNQAPTATQEAATQPVEEEQTIFNVILQEAPADKRVTIYKAIRNLTSFGIIQAKEFTQTLPKALKESVSKEEAEDAKQQLEQAGAVVKIE